MTSTFSTTDMCVFSERVIQRMALLNFLNVRASWLMTSKPIGWAA